MQRIIINDRNTRRAPVRDEDPIAQVPTVAELKSWCATADINNQEFTLPTSWLETTNAPTAPSLAQPAAFSLGVIDSRESGPGGAGGRGFGLGGGGGFRLPPLPSAAGISAAALASRLKSAWALITNGRFWKGVGIASGALITWVSEASLAALIAAGTGAALAWQALMMFLTSVGLVAKPGAKDDPNAIGFNLRQADFGALNRLAEYGRVAQDYEPNSYEAEIAAYQYNLPLLLDPRQHDKLRRYAGSYIQQPTIAYGVTGDMAYGMDIETFSPEQADNIIRNLAPGQVSAPLESRACEGGCLKMNKFWRHADDPGPTSGEVYRSNFVVANIGDLPEGEYGRAYIDENPVRIYVNPRAVNTRMRLALTHEMLHAVDENLKLRLSHDQLHGLSFMIMNEVLPALLALDSRLAGDIKHNGIIE